VRLAAGPSVQSIELSATPGAFDSWGRPGSLERLLHAYFDTATRMVEPLVRVRWNRGAPSIVLVGSATQLIVMSAASVESSGERRAIRVTVTGGLLVDSASTACLSIVLDRRAPHVCARVELVGYQSRGGECPIVLWLFTASQGRLHTLVGRRFLNELGKRWTYGPP
jgi:hypothetical protein